MTTIKLNGAITKVARKVAFKLNKHLPEILMGAGIAGCIGATVLACKATLPAHNVILDAEDELDIVHKHIDRDDYTEDDVKKEVINVYRATGVELAKLYAPAVLVGAASIFAIVASNGILRARVASLVTAYSALDTAFRSYRERVADTIGQDRELEVFHGVKADKKEGRDENGLMPVKKGDRQLVDGYSIYARCFDELNPNWKNNAEFNLTFLRGTQRYLNERLRIEGYLCLNDAYKELGFPPTPEGQLVGWIYSDAEDHTGDNCVSFGLYDPTRGAALGDFINGYNNAVFLDFNVDGVIVDRI